MLEIEIKDARRNLSRLFAQAAAGEPFVIAQDGVPLVRVSAVSSKSTPLPRRTGFMRGEIDVPYDFDTMGSAAIEELFLSS